MANDCLYLHITMACSGELRFIYFKMNYLKEELVVTNKGDLIVWSTVVLNFFLKKTLILADRILCWPGSVRDVTGGIKEKNRRLEDEYVFLGAALLRSDKVLRCSLHYDGSTSKPFQSLVTDTWDSGASVETWLVYRLMEQQVGQGDLFYTSVK